MITGDHNVKTDFSLKSVLSNDQVFHADNNQVPQLPVYYIIC